MRVTWMNSFLCQLVNAYLCLATTQCMCQGHGAAWRPWPRRQPHGQQGQQGQRRLDRGHKRALGRTQQRRGGQAGFSAHIGAGDETGVRYRGSPPIRQRGLAHRGSGVEQLGEHGRCVSGGDRGPPLRQWGACQWFRAAAARVVRLGQTRAGFIGSRNKEGTLPRIESEIKVWRRNAAMQ